MSDKKTKIETLDQEVRLRKSFSLVNRSNRVLQTEEAGDNHRDVLNLRTNQIRKSAVCIRKEI